MGYCPGGLWDTDCRLCPKLPAQPQSKTMWYLLFCGKCFLLQNYPISYANMD